MCDVQKHIRATTGKKTLNLEAMNLCYEKEKEMKQDSNKSQANLSWA